MELPLNQVHMQLSGLELDLTYYIQVNLVAPNKVLVYGHTFKFNLFDLPYGQLELENPINYDATPSTLVIIVLAAVSVAIILILVLCIFKWIQRRKQPDARFARKSVHIRNAKSYTCCNYSEWCYGKKDNEEVFQKTNFNGFDTGNTHSHKEVT